MDDPSDQALASTLRLGDDSGLRWASRVAEAVREQWRRGEEPDAAAVLAAKPELKRYRSVVIDLAHDEYSLRLARGESWEAEEFARRFPSFQRSLCLYIVVNRMLDGNPHLAGLPAQTPWPDVGQQILDFSLIAELGRGTFARVYLASQAQLGQRLVALKVACHGADEAEMLGRLEHPNVVPVYSVHNEPDSGLTAVCMPYLGRATLADVLDRVFQDGAPPRRARVVLDVAGDLNDDLDPAGEWTPDPFLVRASYVDGVLRLAVQLADALAYTHARGICHRDLKPSNVLLSPEGRPLLLDFNLSSDQQLTAVRVGGTLPYMAPEQLRAVVLDDPRRGGRADPRSDLFSLGVIVYELLAGRLPFGDIPWQRSADGVAQALLDRQAGGPLPVRRKNPHVDKRLARSIERCLAFDPDDRPQTAADLALALRRQLTPLRRARRWAVNHPKRVALFAALLLAAALSAGGYFALRDPYSVRQFKMAEQYAAQGDYDRAIRHLNESARSAPNRPQTLLARAKVHQKRGEFGLAIDDLKVLDRIDPDPVYQAAAAYCMAKLSHHDAALHYNNKAAERGYRSPAMLNNMAYSHIRKGRLDRAEEILRRAIEDHPDVGPAHHNFIVIALNRVYGGHPVSDAMIDSTRKAELLCAPSADLFLAVAALYSLASRHDPSLESAAIGNLRRAVRYGSDPAALASGRAFSPLRDLPEFQAVLELKPGLPQPVEAERLVNPLDELSPFPRSLPPKPPPAPSPSPDRAP